MLHWAENYQPVIELYQTPDHPAFSPKVGHLQWRVFPAPFLGGFCSTTWKTRHQNPPIDWELGVGWCYACGLAWLILTTDIVFRRFLQTYMTSGHCSCWFLLVIEQHIFWHYLGLFRWWLFSVGQQKIASAAQVGLIRNVNNALLSRHLLYVKL